MFEESVSAIPSIWESMNSWFTPAVLFVLLNLMIAAIAFTSTLANQKHLQNQGQNQPNLVRSPSVLQRLRSINFYSYRSQEPPPPPPQQHHPHYSHQIQPQINFETHSQYIFAPHEPHQEIKQSVFYGNPQEIMQAHYFPQQIYQEIKPQENQSSHYFFEQTNEEKLQENQTHYFFEQTNEEKPQQNETPFDFQQTHEQNGQKNGSLFDSERAHEENAQENGSHFDSEQVHEDNFENDNELKSLDEVYSHVSRSKSDTKPTAGEVPAKLPAKMKKSASMKSPFQHFEEEDIVEARRPATVKERKAKVAEPDEGVDAKADDFINRFKEQLKLQRVDSIIRYKEMTGRGSEK